MSIYFGGHLWRLESKIWSDCNGLVTGRRLGSTIWSKYDGLLSHKGGRSAFLVAVRIFKKRRNICKDADLFMDIGRRTRMVDRGLML